MASPQDCPCTYSVWNEPWECSESNLGEYKERIQKEDITTLLLAITQPALCQNVAGGNFIQSNGSTPPQFDEVGKVLADLVPSSVSVEITLDLSVVVRDEDGIDTVIGSCKKDNDTIWTNVTMSFSAELREQRYLHSARPLNFTLDADKGLMTWDVVYYASDPLGN